MVKRYKESPISHLDTVFPTELLDEALDDFGCYVLNFVEPYQELTGDRGPGMWRDGEASAIDFIRWGEGLEPLFSDIAVVAFSERLLPLVFAGGSCRVIDWGIGEGSYHPILNIDQYSLVAIDTDKQVTGLVRGEDRFPRDTLWINNGPPYETGDPADAVISVSAFHVLPYNQMVEVLRSLVDCLDEDGFVCHLQVDRPGYGFLHNLPREVLGKMDRYLYNKYKPRRSSWSGEMVRMGNVMNQGGFLGTIFRRGLSDSMKSLRGCSDEEVEAIGEYLALFENYTNSFPYYLKLLQSYNDMFPCDREGNPYQLPDELEREAIGIMGIMGAFIALGTEISFWGQPARSVEERHMFLTKLTPFMLMLRQCHRMFIFDVFEAYLNVLFEEVGLSVETDRVVRLYEGEIARGSGDKFNIFVDGGAEWCECGMDGMEGTVMTARRVIGRKKTN